MCRSRKRAIPYVNPTLNTSFLYGYGQVTQLFHPSFLPPPKHSLVIGCGVVLLSCSQRRTWRSKGSTLWNQSAYKRPSNVYSFLWSVICSQCSEVERGPSPSSATACWRVITSLGLSFPFFFRWQSEQLSHNIWHSSRRARDSLSVARPLEGFGQTFKIRQGSLLNAPQKLSFQLLPSSSGTGVSLLGRKMRHARLGLLCSPSPVNAKASLPVKIFE